MFHFLGTPRSLRSLCMTNSQRVIMNTGGLYVRIGVTFVLSLLSSRFVLGALGVADFGLCSVVAGVMGFMGFVNGAMAPVPSAT